MSEEIANVEARQREEREHITIVANGQVRTIPAQYTLTDFLSSLQVAPQRVVVQLNGVIIARTDYSATVLEPASELEIVTLVGGG